MVARPSLLRLFPLSLLFAPSLLLAEPAADASPIPPEPPRPGLRGLSPEQQRQATKVYRAAKREWEKALPPQEKAKHEAQQAEEDKELALRFSLFPNQEQDEKLIAQTLARPWRDSAAHAGLSPAEIEQLARDKILIEDRQVAQSFSPYIDPERAVFVTTDSLLNGFNVLLSASICELERHRAKQLRQHLEGLLPRVADQAESLENEIQGLEASKAVRHAGLVIGPAIVLLHGSLATIDPRDHPEILHQVELIRRAEAQETPAWLEVTASRNDTIDYSQFRPVGFYASDENLADYFRALRWLQTVPFRPTLDHEFLAAALLDKCRDSAFCDELTESVGTTMIDTFDPIATMPYSLPTPFITQMTVQEFYEEARDKLRQHQGGPLFFQRQAEGQSVAQDTDDPFQLATSRFLPPSAVFGKAQQATDAPPPDGLTIAAAHNSAFARTRLPQPAPALEQLISLPEVFVPNASLEFSVEHSNILWALSAQPDQDAPAFMKGEAWAAKSCLTVLAGWAQGQHRPTPQHHDSGTCDCDTYTLPGFVEPNATFYSRLADFAASTGEYFARQGTFLPLPDDEIRELRAAVEKLQALGPLEAAFHPNMSRDARKRIDQFFDIRSELREAMPPLPKEATFEVKRLAVIAALQDRADQLEKGTIPPQPSPAKLQERWFRLVRLASKLAEISHAQLRGDLADQTVIQRYGHALGFIMGYDDSSWMMPRDDAPRWTEIHRQPAADRGFAIGIGRPRLIHVLYPYEGREVLCTGSVMSYYEYWERDRLTDEEWKAKLDSPAAPPPPDWLAPILAK
jgi:hypothetical protein